jgi:hypothetical protein
MRVHAQTASSLSTKIQKNMVPNPFIELRIMAVGDAQPGRQVSTRKRKTELAYTGRAPFISKEHPEEWTNQRSFSPLELTQQSESSITRIMAKVVPERKISRTSLDPFTDRLYSGVVVFSKSWKEDLVNQETLSPMML